MIRDRRDDILWHASVKPLTCTMSKIDSASLILCNSYLKSRRVILPQYEKLLFESECVANVQLQSTGKPV